MLFLVHPRITKITLNLFHCTEINNIKYLTLDLTQQCWTGMHLKWSLTVGIALLVIYVIGIPLYGGLLLFYNRAKIHKDHPNHEEFHKKYSFLYKGYDVDNKKEQSYLYLWELVVTARKLALLIIMVYYANTPHIQSLLGLLVVIISFILHITVQPFENTILNIAEFASLLTSCITFYLGQFTYSTDENTIHQYISIAALIVNISFLMYMIQLFYISYKLKKKKKNKKQYYFRFKK